MADEYLQIPHRRFWANRPLFVLKLKKPDSILDSSKINIKLTKLKKPARFAQNVCCLEA